MQAQRNRYPRPVARYSDVQGNHVLVTRNATNNVVRLRWPIADVGPADDPTAVGVDGTPQSISPGAFGFCLAVLIGAGFAACTEILAGIVQ